MIKLNIESYRKLLEEDIEWLKKQPLSLEKDHILTILKYELKKLPIYFNTFKNEKDNSRDNS